MNVPNPFTRKSRTKKGFCIYQPRFDPDGNYLADSNINIRFTSMDKIRELILKYNPNLER